jgi:hypothetical protein
MVVLEWNYLPKDFFEDRVNIDRESYNLIISDGIAKAQINGEFYDSKNNMRDELHKKLESRFKGAQLVTQKPYKLSNSTMCRLHENGRREFTISPESATHILTTHSVDIIVKDKDGIVVHDTRKERIENRNNLAELAAKFSSDTLSTSLLESFNNSINDRKNELLHLYEIRDALCAHFKKAENTRKALGITRPAWNRFGKIVNDEPLIQGRHRGQYFGVLREASPSELEEARLFARNLIEAYFAYLDK